LGGVGLDLDEFGWSRLGLAVLVWAGSGCAGLSCAGFILTGLGWAGLGFAGLGFGRVVLV
jgi:hypothetical protein